MDDWAALMSQALIFSGMLDEVERAVEEMLVTPEKCGVVVFRWNDGIVPRQKVILSRITDPMTITYCNWNPDDPLRANRRYPYA